MHVFFACDDSSAISSSKITHARTRTHAHLACSSLRRASASSSAYLALPPAPAPPRPTYRKPMACLRLVSTLAHPPSAPLSAPAPAAVAVSPLLVSLPLSWAFSGAASSECCCCCGGPAAAAAGVPSLVPAGMPAGGPRERSLRRRAWPSVSRIAPRLARALSSASRRMSLRGKYRFWRVGLVRVGLRGFGDDQAGSDQTASRLPQGWREEEGTRRGGGSKSLERHLQIQTSWPYLVCYSHDERVRGTGGGG